MRLRNVAIPNSKIKKYRLHPCFSIPFYNFIQKYDNNVNPVWQCTCHIKEITKHFSAESSSKKMPNSRPPIRCLNIPYHHKVSRKISSDHFLHCIKWSE